MADQEQPLIVVPSYMRQPRDLEVTLELLASVRRTEPDAAVMVIDDASPADVLVDEMAAAKSRLHFDLHRKEENQGFSRTVNIGLQRALDEGRDAVLVNADMEFIDKGWLRVMQTRTRADDSGDLAGIVGAKLLYPNGLIQHGGVFFSLLHRCFEHIYKFAPHDLPEAQKARRCPVTGALQFIRHSTLTEIGLYDEKFKLGWEDVDYCIRAFLGGVDCVYEPKVRAYHFESMFRGDASEKIAGWQNESWAYFMHKYRKQSFADFVPSLI